MTRRRRTSDLSRKLSTAPAPAPNVAVEAVDPGGIDKCLRSVVNLEKFRNKMNDVSEVSAQADYQASMQRTMVSVLHHCTAAFPDFTVSPAKFKTMILFANQLSNNTFMGLTFGEERYLRKIAKSIYSKVTEYLRVQGVDQWVMENVKRKRLSNLNKLRDLNDNRTVQCEHAWLNISAALFASNKL